MTKEQQQPVRGTKESKDGASEQSREHVSSQLNNTAAAAPPAGPAQAPAPLSPSSWQCVCGVGPAFHTAACFNALFHRWAARFVNISGANEGFVGFLLAMNGWRNFIDTLRSGAHGELMTQTLFAHFTATLWPELQLQA